MNDLFFFNPIHTSYSRHFAKMLDVMCDDSQAIVPSGNGNKNVQVTNNQALTGKSLPDFSISLSPPFINRQYSKRLFYHFRLLQMLCNCTTMKSTISELRNTDLRRKDLLSRRFGNMLIYASTMMEILYPRVCIKNIAFHISLIIKVYFTAERTTIVAMLHHLIVFLTFLGFRPDTSHTKELSFPFFCSSLFSLSGSRLFSWHDQFACQPFTIALGKRKPLQISP